MIGIYKYTNKKNGKVYIGKSIHIERRYKEHFREAKKHGEDGCSYFYNALRKYGEEGFTFEVLLDLSYLEGKPDDIINEALDYWEVFYIKQYNANNPQFGYNITHGGTGGNLGELVCKKISESNKKYFETHEPWNKGIKMSEDFVEKMKLLNKGRHPSEETKQKMHDSLYGVKKPEGFGKRVSDDSKGKKQMHLGDCNTWIYRDKIQDAILAGYEYGWV